MPKGTVKQLPASVSPSNATNSKLYWYSSDPAVLKIDKNSGLVKALKKGSARICAKTADGSGKYANARVTVYYQIVILLTIFIHNTERAQANSCGRFFASS